MNETVGGKMPWEMPDNPHSKPEYAQRLKDEVKKDTRINPRSSRMMNKLSSIAKSVVDFVKSPAGYK